METEELEKETETQEEKSGGGEPIPEKEQDPVDELDKEFDDFVKSKSEHKVEKEISSSEGKGTRDFIPDPDELDLVDQFKIQIFTGIFFSLVDGLHLFVYRFISKHELNKEDLALDATDQEGLQMYFQTKRVLDIINKLPVELIGFVHMEWLYFQKYRAITKKKEEEENKKIRIMKHIRKNFKKPTVKNTSEKKPTVKKKKRTKKKKPAKPLAKSE